MSCWFCAITCSRPDGTCQHQLPCCCDGQQPHTCPCASEVWPDPASLPLCPTLHPHPNAVTALPTCVLNVPPQGDALYSNFRAGRPTEYSQHLASRGSLIKVNHVHGTPKTFSKISMVWGRKHYGRSTVVSCHKGLTVCDPGNSWDPALLRDSLPACLDRRTAHPLGWDIWSLYPNRISWEARISQRGWMAS